MKILARRFRTRAGELDLVALDGEVVVFVEVKTRRRTDCGRPSESVGLRKRARLRRTALAFLTRHAWHDRPCRFDVVEVVAPPGSPFPVLRHIPDAFR
jgi:putative endonuclease